MLRSEKEYQKKLQELRVKWKENPKLREIIERQAKALKFAWEEKTKKSGDSVYEMAKQIFLTNP